jgi:hypothetical protein
MFAVFCTSLFKDYMYLIRNFSKSSKKHKSDTRIAFGN